MSTVTISELSRNLIPSYGGVNETINLRGTVVFELPVGGVHSPNITVDLAVVGDFWIGGFTQAPGSSLKIIGAGEFDGDGNANGFTYIGANIVNVVGGTINEFQSHSSGKLEFANSVPSTITVTDSGGGGDHGVVQIDNPSIYHAATQLGFGEIILEGLRATSYSLKNDLLSIFNGNHIIDTMSLTVEPVGGSSPVRFGVSQVGGSVVIHADGSSYHDGGRPLPMHG
jgi:hypothetical protein